MYCLNTVICCQRCLYCPLKGGALTKNADDTWSHPECYVMVNGCVPFSDHIFSTDFSYDQKVQLFLIFVFYRKKF